MIPLSWSILCSIDWQEHDRLVYTAHIRIWSHLLKKSLMENFIFVQCHLLFSWYWLVLDSHVIDWNGLLLSGKLLLSLKYSTETISSNQIIDIEDVMKSTQALEPQYILRFDGFMTSNYITPITTLISSLSISFTFRLLLFIFSYSLYNKVCSKIDSISSSVTNS